MERKVCFISDDGNCAGGWGADIWPKADTLPDKQRVELLQTEGGATRRNSSQLWQSSSSWPSVVWPASQIPLIFSSRVDLFPFLWANSQSCGSLHHGYSLVIMQLTSLLGVGFRVCKTAQRMWFRILSIALKRNWRSLTRLNGSTMIIRSPLTVFLCFCLNLLFDFSNEACSLTEVFQRQKPGRGHGREGSADPPVFHEHTCPPFPGMGSGWGVASQLSLLSSSLIIPGNFSKIPTPFLGLHLRLAQSTQSFHLSPTFMDASWTKGGT